MAEQNKNNDEYRNPTTIECCLEKIKAVRTEWGNNRQGMVDLMQKGNDYPFSALSNEEFDDLIKLTEWTTDGSQELVTLGERLTRLIEDLPETERSKYKPVQKNSNQTLLSAKSSIN